MKKRRIIVLSVLFVILLIGCEKEDLPRSSYHFVRSEEIVEVTEKTKSFRLEVNWTGYFDGSKHFSPIFIIENATTAKHNVHFINTPGQWGTIGAFEHLFEGKTYKDITIIPEKITEQVVIVYSTKSVLEDYPGEEGLFNQFKVILKPKTP